MILQPRITEAISPGVLSNSNELEEYELFLDSQFLNYDEDALSRGDAHSDASEEVHEYKDQFDAQSLGLNSENDQFDEDEEALSEDQLDAKRYKGN